MEEGCFDCNVKLSVLSSSFKGAFNRCAVTVPTNSTLKSCFNISLTFLMKCIPSENFPRKPKIMWCLKKIGSAVLLSINSAFLPVDISTSSTILLPSSLFTLHIIDIALISNCTYCIRLWIVICIVTEPLNIVLISKIFIFYIFISGIFWLGIAGALYYEMLA